MLVSLEHLQAQVKRLPPQREQAVQAVQFIQSIQSLPVEYRADLVFSSIEADHTLLRRRDVANELQNLFTLAQQTVHPFPISLAALRTQDVMEAQLSADSQQHVDTLSIQTRIIDQLIINDPKDAFRLAQTIRFPLEPAPCSTPYVDDPSSYYRMLDHDIPIWLSAKVANQQEITEFIETHLATQLKSASQISGAAALLANAPLDDDDFVTSLSAFEGATARLQISGREMGWLVEDDELFKRFQLLIDRSAKARQPVARSISLLRAVLLASSRMRCADPLVSGNQILKSYSQLLEKYKVTDPALALDSKVFVAPDNNGKAILHPITPTGQDDLRLKSLQKYSAHATAAGHIEDVYGWETTSNEIFNSLEAGSFRDSCEVCDFYGAFLRYFLLINFSPSSPTSTAQERALAGYTRYLESSSIKSSEPMAWIAKIKLLINFSRLATSDQQRNLDRLHGRGLQLMNLPSPDGHVVLDELTRARDPVCTAYVRYETLFHPSWSSPY